MRIGSGNIIANNCLLGGHVSIGDKTFLGSGAVFHQFIHIGELCMTQGNITISKDILPYYIANRLNRLIGLNVVGLRRTGLNSNTPSVQNCHCVRLLRNCWACKPLQLGEKQ